MGPFCACCTFCKFYQIYESCFNDLTTFESRLDQPDLDLKKHISECSAYLVGLAMRARPIRAVNMSNSAVRKISWFKAWVRGFLTWGELFTRIAWAFLNPCSATWKEEHQSKRKFTCLPWRLDGWFIVQCTISNLFQIFISRQFYKITNIYFFSQHFIINFKD